MICEIVAIGTELLLGDVIDTNAAWIGKQLAEAGISCHYQVKVGDNQARIVAALQQALERSDAVICCGGLGPTQDDITRESIAAVLDVPLVRDETVAQALENFFISRGRPMPLSNLRQAEAPRGSRLIHQRIGTAPGLICEAGKNVIYAVPGVPTEMMAMLHDAVLPDMRARMGEEVTILSRMVHVWGMGESTVAERVAERVEALEETKNPTIAFLTSASSGVTVRITASAHGERSHEMAVGMLDDEEASIRDLIGDELVYGTDGDTLESVVAAKLFDAGLTVAVAESLSSGLLASRLSETPGATAWFKGGVVAYATEVKQHVLGIAPGPVVSGSAAEEMASGAAELLGADVGVALSGVAGPDTQEGQPVGTVWMGFSVKGTVFSERLQLFGDRSHIRALSTSWALDRLRRALS